MSGCLLDVSSLLSSFFSLLFKSLLAPSFFSHSLSPFPSAGNFSYVTNVSEFIDVILDAMGEKNSSSSFLSSPLHSLPLLTTEIDLLLSRVLAEVLAIDSEKIDDVETAMDVKQGVANKLGLVLPGQVCYVCTHTRYGFVFDAVRQALAGKRVELAL